MPNKTPTKIKKVVDDSIDSISFNDYTLFASEQNRKNRGYFLIKRTMSTSRPWFQDYCDDDLAFINLHSHYT